MFLPSAVHCPLAAAAAAVAASTPAWYVLKPGCAEPAAAVAIAAAAAVVAVDVAMDEDGDLRSGFEINTIIIVLTPKGIMFQQSTSSLTCWAGEAGAVRRRWW